MKYVIIIILIVLAIIGAKFIWSSSEPKSEPAASPLAETAVPLDSRYTDYSPERLAEAEGKVVLYFHADWCPICRSIEKDINSSLSLIPENLIILKVNYDKEVALKQKYGVTYQHTFVQVDKSGSLIKKWSNSDSMSLILANVL